MAEPVLTLHGVTKTYGALVVSDAVTLDVGPTEVHALIGPNGAGKSTLVGEIAGSVAPDSGRILFAGRDVTGLGVTQRARLGLARVFQTSSVINGFTALENCILAAAAVRRSAFRFFRPIARRRRLVDEAAAMLARVGLSGREHVPAGRLAHGERRALELAMGLIQKPKLLLLDEPMAGTGREETERLTELLAGLKGTVAMLIVEHDMDTVFRLADRITVLISGAVAVSGDEETVKTNPTVRTAYLGEAAP
jgi:branched-chain amino acid transport system ATP-binding protein